MFEMNLLPGRQCRTAYGTDTTPSPYVSISPTPVYPDSWVCARYGRKNVHHADQPWRQASQRADSRGLNRSFRSLAPCRQPLADAEQHAGTTHVHRAHSVRNTAMRPVCPQQSDQWTAQTQSTVCSWRPCGPIVVDLWSRLVIALYEQNAIRHPECPVALPRTPIVQHAV